MSLDCRYLDLLMSSDVPCIHFYRWEKKTVTYGYFSKLEVLNLKRLKQDKWHVVKRPTAGGILFHPYDFAFSLLVPARCTRASLAYLAVAELMQDVLHPLIPTSITSHDGEKASPFCMLHPRHFDLMYRGKKVMGVAQRRTRFGFLHQASISLKPPDPAHVKLWVNGVQPDFQKTCFSFADHLRVDTEKARLLIERHILDFFTKK